MKKQSRNCLFTLLLLRFTVFVFGGVTVHIYGLKNGSITLPVDIRVQGPRAAGHRRGGLTVRGLTERDGGLFVAEAQVGGKPQYFSYVVQVTGPVTLVTVSCDKQNESVASLQCSGEGPLVQYSWEGPGISTPSWSEEMAGPQVRKDSSFDSVYSCVAKNPVSEKKSRPFPAAKCFDGSFQVRMRIDAGVGVALIILQITGFL
ncbi:hypothetical protein GN956_G13369 [Arapaima gigas]